MNATKPPRDRQGMSARVLDHLRQGIKDGLFSPGQRLIEADLTREFAVSRGTVREALGRLEAEGLVEITPHRGASVRQMTRRDVAELFRAREILEGGAARLAAEQITDSPLRSSLEQELVEQRRWTEATDISGYTEANAHFHDLIIEIADNQLVAGLINQLQTHTWRILFLGFVSIDGVRTSARQHIQIAEAILANDPASAEALMRQHIRHTADDTLSRQHPLYRSEPSGRRSR
ncbi:GntR family transcriptional regulator [Acrocarpospora pleiomorpha]|uniref:GntR family transcriptional regulator n=1 Tax=Acrocarpospora pleiomorpha TaxID=90975 RepID=A0A5M3XTX8_9ACTN|nr:GntR family transcriptional regulator [Acrocarpospora pleiomorpha]GES24694.1 GntR family transcriptional regulator [Acrocarpospora pleiomorpha]